MDPKRVVETHFAQPQKCYGHCEEPSKLRFLESGKHIVTCYACPAGYVSKIMVYGSEGMGEVLRTVVTKAFGGEPVKGEDIRVATRHPWDLDVPGFEMKVAYWTQNYRGSKNTDPNRPALFLCSECGSPYVKSLTEQGMMCGDCMARSAGGSDRH